jgi:hypothetical protein
MAVLGRWDVPEDMTEVTMVFDFGVAKVGRSLEESAMDDGSLLAKNLEDAEFGRGVCGAPPAVACGVLGGNS